MPNMENFKLFANNSINNLEGQKIGTMVFHNLQENACGQLELD